MANRPFRETLESVERAELSTSFWKFGLLQRLDTAVALEQPIFMCTRLLRSRHKTIDSYLGTFLLLTLFFTRETCITFSLKLPKEA